MPKCKNCGRQISRFDADLCPYCGEEKPFEAGYETQDMTSFVKPITGEGELKKSKSKVACGLLCLFLGIFGAHYFYLGFKNKGIICSIFALAIAIGGGLILGFSFPDNLALAFVPLEIVYLFFIVFSLRYFISSDEKDASGAYLH